MAVKIMYKDRNIIVCVKKAGMLSEPHGNERNLPAEASETLRGMGEQAELFTVHRLDRPVGGLTLLARNKKAASFYTSLISSRSIEKKYLAIVHGKPDDDSGTYTDLLFRDSSKNKTYVVDRVRKGVREAVLDYKLLKSIADDNGSILSLIEIDLKTGRTHQIRAQFSHRKMPIFADGRYGASKLGASSDESIALFAYSLTFKDMKGIERSIKALPDKNYPWSLFEYELNI